VYTTGTTGSDRVLDRVTCGFTRPTSKEVDKSGGCLSPPLDVGPVDVSLPKDGSDAVVLRSDTRSPWIIVPTTGVPAGSPGNRTIITIIDRPCQTIIITIIIVAVRSCTRARAYKCDDKIVFRRRRTLVFFFGSNRSGKTVFTGSAHDINRREQHLAQTPPARRIVTCTVTSRRYLYVYIFMLSAPTRLWNAKDERKRLWVARGCTNTINRIRRLYVVCVKCRCGTLSESGERRSRQYLLL
jgi:hypothetical protein